MNHPCSGMLNPISEKELMIQQGSEQMYWSVSITTICQKIVSTSTWNWYMELKPGNGNMMGSISANCSLFSSQIKIYFCNPFSNKFWNLAISLVHVLKNSICPIFCCSRTCPCMLSRSSSCFSRHLWTCKLCRMLSENFVLRDQGIAFGRVRLKSLPWIELADVHVHVKQLLFWERITGIRHKIQRAVKRIMGSEWKELYSCFILRIG